MNQGKHYIEDSQGRSCTTCDYADISESGKIFCCKFNSPNYDEGDWCYHYIKRKASLEGKMIQYKNCCTALYRGKSKDTLEWVYGSYWESQLDPSKVYIIDEHRDFIEVVPSTIGWFTGLTDKNAQMIFTGDVVHYIYEPGKGFWNANQYSIIEWTHAGLFMTGIMKTNKYALMSGYLSSTPYAKGQNFEVVGNVVDNPEWLTEPIIRR